MEARTFSSSRQLWLLVAAVCIIAAVLDTVTTLAQNLLSGDKPDYTGVIAESSEWLLLGALTPITYYLGRRFPLRRPGLRKAVLVHLTGAAVLCIAWATAGVLLRRAMGDRWWPTFAGDLLGWTLTSVPWAFLLYFAILGCVLAFTYFEESRERELQASRLSSQLSEARLSALRMQLQPHFLFNTLNAITVLVRDQHTQLAGRMLERLSDLLRSVLRSDQPHEILLSEELDLVNQYLAIEQVRFPDRLHVRQRIDPAVLNALVPSFILQPLVENAIRHGVAQQPDAVNVEIGAETEGENLVLWVRNDSPTTDVTRAGHGVGLQNTRLRLETLYGERAELQLESSGGQTTARVRMPLRRTTRNAANG